MSPCSAVQINKELEAKLKQIKEERVSLAVTLNEYKVVLNNSKKLAQKELKRLALALGFKGMEQEQKDIWA